MLERERWVVMSSPALVVVDEIEGEEELNRLFAYRVHATIRDRVATRERAARLLESPVALRFEDAGAEVRTVNGIVSEVDVQHDLEHDLTRLFLTVVPRAWLMTQRFGAEIFLDVSVVSAIEAKLQAVGLQRDTDDVIALRSAYPVREIIVQYNPQSPSATPISHAAMPRARTSPTSTSKAPPSTARPSPRPC